MDSRICALLFEVGTEIERAEGLFPAIGSPHEALGLLDEEFREVRDEVHAFNLAKGRDTRPAMRAELIQLAAMCVRTITDLGL